MPEPTHHCLCCVLQAIDRGILTLSRESLLRTCSCGGTPHRNPRLKQASKHKGMKFNPTTLYVTRGSPSLQNPVAISHRYYYSVYMYMLVSKADCNRNHGKNGYSILKLVAKSIGYSSTWLLWLEYREPLVITINLLRYLLGGWWETCSAMNVTEL